MGKIGFVGGAACCWIADASAKISGSDVDMVEGCSDEGGKEVGCGMVGFGVWG